MAVQSNDFEVDCCGGGDSGTGRGRRQIGNNYYGI